VTVGLAALLAATGCGAETEGLGLAADGTRRAAGGAGEVAVDRPATPPATPPPPASMSMPPPAADPGQATVIIRAEKLAARRIVARLIYAEKIEAEALAVADLRMDDGKLWESEGAKADLSFDELRADTVYTKEIKAGQLEAAQVFVKDLKVSGDNADKGKDKDKDEGED
jgi:hypothetical protein